MTIDEWLNKTEKEIRDDLIGIKKDNTLLVNRFNQTSAKLIKAKDILRRLMASQPTPSSMYEEADLVGWREVNKEAEQFLKE